MTFDAVSYWLDRGERYERDFVDSPLYQGQEAALRELLGRLEFSSVLEVGCGFGRIGELIATVRPSAAYTGIDLSPAQIAAAHRRLPNAELVVSTIADFDPDRRFDLVIAVEVLMHVPPEEIDTTVAKLRSLATRDLVTLDWDTPLAATRRIAPHNWLHDYRRLLPSARRASNGHDGLYHLRKRAASRGMELATGSAGGFPVPVQTGSRGRR